jgi:2-polyprenyl-3-methyl-5-hydroxy-6-metoxy-1,4-benzoquinol methylase
MQLLTGMAFTQMLATAAHLSIADRLAGGPKTSEDIAREADTNADATYRLMRALGALGVLTEHQGHRFELTPVGACLTTNHPASLASFAKYLGSSWHWAIWSELLYSVRTGQNAFTRVHGKTPFEWMSTNPEAMKVFGDAMTSLSRTTAYAVVRAYDFSASRRIVDVGGGQGLLIAQILQANPRAKGLLFDVPPVAEGAKAFLSESGLIDRCEAVGGDFFQSVPQGHDTYLLKHIIHDWSDERAVLILKNVAKAMSPEGRVLVVEQVIPPVGVPDFTKLVDLEMLVLMDGGRERTAEEYDALFRRVGLKLERVIPTESAMSVVEAKLA